MEQMTIYVKRIKIFGSKLQFFSFLDKFVQLYKKNIISHFSLSSFLFSENSKRGNK